MTVFKVEFFVKSRGGGFKTERFFMSEEKAKKFAEEVRGHVEDVEVEE